MLATTPAEYVDAFFTFYMDGALDESGVLPTVQDVTGSRRARSPSGSTRTRARSPEHGGAPSVTPAEPHVSIRVTPHPAVSPKDTRGRS